MKFFLTCFGFLIFSYSNILHAEVKAEKLAKDDWLLVKTTNFEIITDMDERDARSLIEELEDYRQFTLEVLNTKLVSSLKPLKILAVSGRSNFSKLGLPSTIDGIFYINEIDFSAIANVNDYKPGLKSASYGRHVLFHEYNHFLVRFLQTTNFYPKWYNEGAADYYATFKTDGKTVSIGDPKAISGRAWGMFDAFGRLNLDIETLFKTTTLPIYSKKESDKILVSQFYSQAFYVFHYLNSDSERKLQLKMYLDYVNQGLSVDKAFSQAFHCSYAELKESVLKYITKYLAVHVYSVKDGEIKFAPVDILVKKLDKTNFYRETYSILMNYDDAGSDAAKSLINTTIELNPDLLDAKIYKIIFGCSEQPDAEIKFIEGAENQTGLSYAFRAKLLSEQKDLMLLTGKPEGVEIAKSMRSYLRKAIKQDPTFGMSYVELGQLYEYLPDSEPLREGLVVMDTGVMFDQSAKNFELLANYSIRLNKGVDSLYYVREAVSVLETKKNSKYSLLLSNLEILQISANTAGELTAVGIKYGDGSIYEGLTKENKPHGVGKLTRPNGATFEGEFVNGVMQGKGKLVDEFNNIYEGDFKDGIARGRAKISIGNVVYEGETNYTLRQGQGKIKTPTVSYEGGFWMGFRHGAGALTPNKTESAIKGNWVFGRYQWPELEGVLFTGSISDTGKRNDKGICEDVKTKILSWCEYKDDVKVSN